MNRLSLASMCRSIALCSTVLISSFAIGQGALSVSGEVRDASGAVIPGATIEVDAGTFHAATTSNEKGQFSVSGVPPGSGTIEVTAPGFGSTQQTWNSNAGSSQMNIVLRPAAASEQVVVSATRTQVPLSNTPGSTILLSSSDVQAIPALRVDDALRAVPGFSLFRRSGSRTANPTSQGVSLRGLGGTAASRALVLMDGIPLVDPFGGWVFWDRVPRASVSQVEVFRGGASNLYGSSALGGVVQFFERQPESPSLNLEMSYGNERTPDLSFWTGTRAGRWDFSLASEMFRTRGYVLVPDSVRGSVDVPATSETATVYARVGRDFGKDGKIFGRGNFYTESRDNGTPTQTNDTMLGEGAIGVDDQIGVNDSISARLYGSVQGYNQRFSAIASDRNSETLTDIQHVPEQVLGGGVQWTHVLRKSQTLIAGGDLNEVMGWSNEQLFTGLNQARNGGGRQRTLGFFGEDVVRIGKWTLIPAARVDYWRNFEGNLITIPTSGSPNATAYPDRSDVAFNPRLSVLRTINDHLSVTASIYRAFRAPTLNELYRTFRVGNVLTNNNAALSAERLTGAEAGANYIGWDRKLELRGTFFWSDIVDPVQNVTLSTTPSLITRQKENLGRTRARGVELDGVIHVNRDVQFSAGYAYTAATVASYPGNPGGVNLVGLDVPQVPRNVFTWEGRYWNPSVLMLSVLGRFVGRQFDDDQNQFPLDAFYTMDITAGRTITRNIEIFAAIENILNQRYQVAKTLVVNLGPPILVRGGVRLTFPATPH
jgi:outer membrane receptor protein involved in Fe transport